MIRRRGALLLILAAAASLAGCSGGGGAAAGAAPPAGQPSVSGAITFDRVPVAGDALDYAATEAAPARGITVQALADGAVLASTTTDNAGRYALNVPAETAQVTIRALAEMRRAGVPGWHYRVVDNTMDDALFVLEGSVRTLTGGTETVNLHAPSGWDGAGYSAVRSAAPFAILDVVSDVTQFVLESAPDTVFPPLVLHWSPNNIPALGADGEPDFAAGEIGSSLYRHGDGIYLLGAADSDTDEYDRHVVAHEWAHYLESSLGRSDNIGGPHARGDQLDMRTAFSEGFANAFAAMALGDTRYVDVLGPGQSVGFVFDIKGPYLPPPYPANPSPGWFSEESIQEILYALFDAAPGRLEDTIELGFAPLLDVLVDDLQRERALTSIFAFAHALRERQPESRAAIDALLAAHAIGPFEDAFGTGEANAGWPLEPTAAAPGDILPIYKALEVGGSVRVCSTDAYNYDGDHGSANKLGSRAFVRFETQATGMYEVAARTAELPPGAIADPDIVLHAEGVLYVSESAPRRDQCTAATPHECVERFERFLGPGVYVLEVYEWTNTQRTNGDYPPIGRTCFDVTVSLR